MFQKLKQIFGVGDDMTAAGRQVSLLQAVDESPRYLPASRLTEAQIHAVGEDGSVWVPWREDADGQAWYQRVSGDSQAVAPAILGFDSGSPLNPDDLYEPRTDLTADELLARYHARQLKRRNAMFPFVDSDQEADSNES